MAKKRGGQAKFETEQAFKDKCLEYFEKCAQEKSIPSKAGLRVHLDIDKSTYSDYKKRFPQPLKKAEDIIESEWVKRLSGVAATGAIFYLKNAFFEDYRDRKETDLTSGGKPLMIQIPKEIAEKNDLK